MGSETQPEPESSETLRSALTITNTNSIDLNQYLPIVEGAAFDSDENQRGERCLPGTRIVIIHTIREWVSSPQGQSIFWLNGVPGTGKSTIARTIAAVFQKERLLGASFFFKKCECRVENNAKHIFTTIARQLGQWVPQITPKLQQALLTEPDIAEKAMKEQFEKLILRPFQSLEQRKPKSLNQPILIVLDALEECAEEVGFSQISTNDYDRLPLDEIPSETIAHDISVFLTFRLSEIRNTHDLPFDWPGQRYTKKLVDLSVPLFMVAANICQEIEDSDCDPRQTLVQILTSERYSNSVDKFYIPILNQLAIRYRGSQQEDLQSLIGVVLMLETPLSVGSLSRLLGLPTLLTRVRLKKLRSFLRVQDDVSMPQQQYHLAVKDYLLDPWNRFKTPLWVDENETHRKLALRCLNVCESLQQNICRLDLGQGAQIHHSTVTASLRDRYIPPFLQYSCRYWASHLMRCGDPAPIMRKEVLPFLEKHFLHWLEAMSLLGLVSEALQVTIVLQKAGLNRNTEAISVFLQDARRFALKNRRILDTTPLLIYSPDFVFAPPKSPIRRIFFDRSTNTKSILHEARLNIESIWGPELQTLHGHSDGVLSIACSPDGKSIASGSSDRTIRIWDSQTGALQSVLEGNPAGVSSLCFSRDGRLLSASRDRAARIWDSSTGVMQHVHNGDAAEYLCFSPSGQLITLSNREEPMETPESATNNILARAFLGHKGRVLTAVFSPSSQLIASISLDNVLLLWDTSKRTEKQKLKTEYTLRCLEFSPDGLLLATGCVNGVVIIWDMNLTRPIRYLRGHHEESLAVSFSPDGILLAGGSADATVVIWKIATGEIQQTLRGHSDSVTSVEFVKDGRIVASGSRDRTVRLWEVNPPEFEVHNLPADKREHTPDCQDSECSDLSFDGSSVFSAPDSIPSTRSLESGRLTMNSLLIQQFANLLRENQQLVSLISGGISERRIGLLKMKSSFRRLLKHFADNLKAEALDERQKDIRTFVSCYSANITQELFDNILTGGEQIIEDSRDNNREEGLKEPRFPVENDLKSLHESCPSRERQVEDYLENLYGVPPPARSPHQLNKSPGESEDGSVSEESDDEEAYEGGLQNLDQMKEFILESYAYQIFMSRLEELVQPTLYSQLRHIVKRWSVPEHKRHGRVARYKLHNLVTELRCVSPDQLRLEKTSRGSSLSKTIGRWQHEVESWSGERWDWWPLPRCHRPLRESESRLHWTCMCGEERSAEIPEKLARHLRSIIKSIPVDIDSSQNFTSSTEVHLENASGAASAQNPTQISNRAPQQNDQQCSGLSDSQSVRSRPLASNISFANMEVAKQHVLLVANKGGDHRLAQIRVDNLTCGVFFSTMKKEYFSLRGRLRGWLSAWRFSHCDFYKTQGLIPRADPQ
ncbi:unnamed protein product [Penicillium pancosmium]